MFPTFNSSEGLSARFINKSKGIGLKRGLVALYGLLAIIFLAKGWLMFTPPTRKDTSAVI